jgi:hypothetical protein
MAVEADVTKPKNEPRTATDGDEDDSFRLVSVHTTTPPTGSAGRDWLVYRIAQGTNEITGYRRGDIKSARVDLEKIVVGLNERRLKRKDKSGPKPQRAASPSPAATRDDDAGE